MEIFKEIITALNPFFKQNGFTKKGNTYYLEVNKNYGLVNFQKSRESTKDLIKFTINFGIYSNFLGQLEYDYNNLLKPEFDQCQWQARVGTFMSGSDDYWWSVNLSDDLNNVTNNVMDIVRNNIMPEMYKRLSDDGLINCWMNETFAGTTEIGRFKYLTTLLKAKGDFNTLNQVIETFMKHTQGKPNAIIAIEHLKEIQYGK